MSNHNFVIIKILISTHFTIKFVGAELIAASAVAVAQHPRFMMVVTIFIVVMIRL